MVREALAPAERMLWLGRPSPGVWSRRALGISLLGVIWCLVTLYGTLAILDFSLPRFKPFDWRIVLALGPFLFFLFGLLILAYPFWERLRSERTVYVLTDRRAVIFDYEWTRGSFRGDVEVKSFGPEKLKGRFHRIDPKGRGDIIFEQVTERDSDGDVVIKEQGFKGIRDVQDVDKLIEEL
jgi:hypothetical protein